MDQKTFDIDTFIQSVQTVRKEFDRLKELPYSEENKKRLDIIKKEIETLKTQKAIYEHESNKVVVDTQEEDLNVFFEELEVELENVYNNA